MNAYIVNNDNFIFFNNSYNTDRSSISNQLSNNGINSIYSIIYDSGDGTIILLNKQIRENKMGSFIKLTPNYAIDGKCLQSTECSKTITSSSNILKILLFSNSKYSGSWTSFCSAYYFY